MTKEQAQEIVAKLKAGMIYYEEAPQYNEQYFGYDEKEGLFYDEFHDGMDYPLPRFVTTVHYSEIEFIDFLTKGSVSFEMFLQRLILPQK